MRLSSRHRRSNPLLASAVLVFFSFVALAQASPRDDAWKLRRTDPARCLSMLQGVVRTDPTDAKAYWFMTLVLHDMGRDSEAEQALQSAKSDDPSLGFARNPGAVAKLESRLSGASAPGAANSATSSPSGAPSSSSSGRSQSVTESLQSSGVFVAPNMRGAVDPDSLSQALHGLPVTVDAIVVDHVPPGRSLFKETQKMHDYLHLGDGVMIAVAGRTVAVYAPGLSTTQLQTIAEDSAVTFNAQGYVAGITQIGQSVASEEVEHGSSKRKVVLLIIAIPAGIILFLVLSGRKNRADSLTHNRVAAQELASLLTPAFEKLDTDIETAAQAETDPARKQALLDHRTEAGSAFSSAIKRLNSATTDDDYASALGALHAAQAQMKRASNLLHGHDENDGIHPVAPVAGPAVPAAQAYPTAGPSSGGTPVGATPPAPFEMPPLGAAYPGGQQGYGLDFFTSQPVPVNQMVPVDMNVNGQTRRVWASPQSAQMANSGNPQVATVPYQGQQVPWFEAPHYNPWRDFGTQIMTSLGVNLLLDSLLGSRHWGGYGNYGSYYGGGGWSGWGGSGFSNYGSGFGSNFGPNFGSDFGDRDPNYAPRMNDASQSAGSASLDAPFAGAGWVDSSPGDPGTLDSSGGGASTGSDSS